MRTPRSAVLAATLSIAASLSATAQIPATQGGTLGFYRFPALHDDVLVFAAEGDLWRVPATGGVAHRLTTHPNEERYPVISPDGQTLAFAGRYEGPQELYTMPIGGGLPTRWTYEAQVTRPVTWRADGRLVYESFLYSTLPHVQLVALDLDDDTRERIPLAAATSGSYATNGDLYFVRPEFHNNVTKRYVGGTARDVWKFAAGASEAVELTGDYPGESHSPMAWGGRVYFLTDRDGTMNIWSMDPNGRDLRQHTRHSGFDVRDPSLQGGRIAYEVAGDIWLYDIGSEASARVPVTLASDFDQLRERWVDEPMQYLSSAHLAPDGESVVLTARGRVFVAPIGDGRIVRASPAEGVRYRDVSFLPGGRTLLGLSDAPGEMQWEMIPANGIGDRRQVTRDPGTQYFGGVPSPDGRWVAFDDVENNLWVADLVSGDRRRVSESNEGIGSYSWSPDGRWLAYAEAAPNTFMQLKLYGVESGARAEVTSDRVNSRSAAWDPDGDFLYFLSDRHLVSLVGGPWGARQPEPFFDKQWEVYEVALRPGLRSPFTAPDELVAREDSTAQKRPESAPVEIDLEGLRTRTSRVPIPAGNYGALATNGRALFFLNRDADEDDDTRRLEAVQISDDEPEVVTVVEGITSFELPSNSALQFYELSANGEKLLFRQGRSLFVIDARAAEAGPLADHRLDLSDWAFSIDTRQDFREVFYDLWRQERDWFYDRNMNGVDWEAERDRYLPLVDRVTTRDELSDVIGQMVGELSALHTRVAGGDLRTGDDNITVPSLGARIMRTPGGDKIEYIYRSDPDYPEERSPLADPALGVSEGDVILTVNGRSVLEEVDIGALLLNQQARPVRLGLRRARDGSQYEAMVRPIENEQPLRFSDWEYTRRLAVEEQSEGRIGYVHLRAMGAANLTEWYRQFYPVFNRQGLILDVRRNNGGNIDSIILEKLIRQAWGYMQPRAGEPLWNMQYAFRGHMVVLVDQNTYSDGESFAEGFRRLGLGEVIGTQTWGGGIWLSDRTRATDGGLARTPELGVYTADGEWLIEQVGVAPDILVDNLPHATFDGTDAQLDAAIRYLQQKIAEDPRDVPEPPPYPNRAFPYGPERPTATGGDQARR